MASKVRNDATNAIHAAQDGFPIDSTLNMVRNNIKFQLDGETMYIPCWCGKPGMGKTTHAKMIADELQLTMYYVSMAKPYECATSLSISNY